MVAAGGSEFAPRSKPQPEGTLVEARAWRWQRMLDDGVYASVSEIGDGREHLEELREPDSSLALLALGHH
jgi:hypothetical protein